MKAELNRRALPTLLSRAEMMAIMQREVYGFLPNVPFSLSVSEPISVEPRYQCGNVEHSFVQLTVTVGEGSHAFRVDRLLHKDGKRRPLILFLNFHPELKSPYFPTEQMSEYEADYLVAYYKDITTDDADFENGIAPLLLPDGQTDESTAAYKKDIGGIDLQIFLLRMLSAAFRRNIGNCTFQNLQQSLLHTFAGYITGY